MAISTNERLKHIERMLMRVLRYQHAQISAQNLEVDLELEQMADFKELADTVAKIKGTVASTKTFIQGLKTKIEETAAGMDDGPDQAAVVALAAELGGAEADLAEAIAANPVQNPGGSTGGNTEG